MTWGEIGVLVRDEFEGLLVHEERALLDKLVERGRQILSQGRANDRPRLVSRL